MSFYQSIDKVTIKFCICLAEKEKNGNFAPDLVTKFVS